MAEGVTIGPAGGYQSDSGIEEINAAALHANTIIVSESLPGGLPGTLILSGGMSAETISDVRLDGPIAGVTPSCTPPILTVASDAVVKVGGDLQIIGSGSIDYSSTRSLILNGSFDNQSIRPEGFEWRAGGLIMADPLNPPAKGFSRFIEAAGRDNGPSALVAAEYEFGTLEISAGADVSVVDLFDNDEMGQGACTEALYVDNLVVEAGATLRVNGTHVYYKNLANSGAIIFSGCGSLLSNPFCSANLQCGDSDRCTFDSCDAAGLCANEAGGLAIVFEETFLGRSFCFVDPLTTCIADIDCSSGGCEKMVVYWSAANPYDRVRGDFVNGDDIGSYLYSSYQQHNGVGFSIRASRSPVTGSGTWCGQYAPPGRAGRRPLARSLRAISRFRSPWPAGISRHRRRPRHRLTGVLQLSIYLGR